ncbi:RseC/MucC-like positive regulator of sigma(E) [Rhodothalassium salexigens DSM 2132]|uniref:RseC/MucC-like positive regulator of sigma(E) n=1 Tax=Rhodothalassium salexigens DSM 2132 TaxID=1188247 RepID=A0A4R2PGM1_RHOSA|nr:SoxR reducing system RseC family protein [Rhodothalassium salexigens]MBB4211549.1 sigma-E factor negative regulatory protein RseC [Rhodothalassium salexigens DSM 2132]TCP34519.1 RseC/MucC-like positive regulator of sigma(E) [Rhodothalassium salexigens DSM 2132]
MSERPAPCPAPSDGDPRRALRQTLAVVAVDGDRVRLRAERLTGCAQCAARAGCGAGAWAAVLDSAPLEIALACPEPVAPGDRVVVTMAGGRFLRAAGLAYLVPPLALALTAGLAAALGLSDLTIALLCGPVLAASLLPARLAERRGRAAAELRVEAVFRQPAGDPP